MKILSVCLVALFICSSLYAQQPTITFRVVDGANKTLSHALPVEGKYFPEMPKDDTLNAIGELVLPNTETVAGAYVFYFHGTYRLYVMPGQRYTVTIDRKKENHVQVEGPEQEAELALLKLNWDFSQQVGARLYKQDPVFANDKQQVMHLQDSCLQPFEQLYKQHKMSESFYAYAKALINNYYASVLASVSMLPMFNAVYNKDSAGYDAAALRRLDDQVQEAIKMIDIANPATFTADTYQEYALFYQLMYLGYHRPLMEGKPLVKGAGNGKIIFYGVEEEITKEPAREYCLAFTLQSLILQKQFEVYIPDLYREFVGQYPNSRYIKLLAPGIEKVENFHAAKKNELSPDQRFVANYDSIATVEELLSKFKDKIIYIDMWATWCGPCKAQFEFKKDIDPFLKSKHVDVLYLSIDRESDKQKWINMIKYYNLDGYHVMASEKLVNDIRKVFGRNKDLYIPRYIICKNGKIIVKDARKPQEKDALCKQIESVL